MECGGGLCNFHRWLGGGRGGAIKNPARWPDLVIQFVHWLALMNLLSAYVKTSSL